MEFIVDSWDQIFDHELSSLDRSLISVLPAGFDAIVVNQALVGLRCSHLPAGSWPTYSLKQHHLLWVLTSPSPEARWEIENHFDQCPCPVEVYGEGDSILVPAGVSHRVTLPPALSATLWLFDQTQFKQIVNCQPRPDGLRQLMPQAKIHDRSLYNLTMALQTEFPRDQENGETPAIYGEQLVLALATRLFAHHSACQLELPGPLRATDLTRLLAYIDSHLEQDLSNQHLASLVNLQVADLEWCFEAVMAMSLQHYIEGQRQQRLQQLLKGLGLGQRLMLYANQFFPDTTVAASPRPGNLTSFPQHGPHQRAIAWLNQQLLTATGKPLTDTQARLLGGVLRGQRYSQLAQQYNQSEGHLKGVAADLWKQLSQTCGEPIRKPNLRSYLQRQGLLTETEL